MRGWQRTSRPARRTSCGGGSGAEGALRLSAADARLVTRWLLKTLILEMHPRTRLDHPVLDASAAPSRWSDPLPQSHYDWMIAAGGGQLPDPPRDLSLWVYRREAGPGTGHRPPGIYVPTVTEEGGQPVKFRYHQAGWYGIGFDLVYHPGWPITHPLEVDQRAAQLWPVDAPLPLDLGTLPVIAPDDLVAFSGAIEVRLLRGSLGSGLPPLAAPGLPFRQLDRVPPQLRGWTVKGSSTP